MIIGLKTVSLAFLIGAVCFILGSPVRSLFLPSSAEEPKSSEAQAVSGDEETLGLSLPDFMSRAREILKAAKPPAYLTEPDKASQKAKNDDIESMLRQGAGLPALPADDEELFGVGVALIGTVDHGSQALETNPQRPADLDLGAPIEWPGSDVVWGAGEDAHAPDDRSI
jgi:hypothetical protein